MDLSRIPYSLPPTYTGDTKKWADALSQFLVGQFSKLQELTGGSLRWQNLRSKLISHSNTAAADTAFQVTHNLGKIPEFYIANVDTTGAMIYATTTPAGGDMANWTETTIDLRCNLSGAGTPIELVILVM